MAKTSKIVRQAQREQLVHKHAKKRDQLRVMSKNVKLSLEERMEARAQLALMPRNSAAVRLRNRCQITGRPRGYVGRLGISRNQVRELGHQALLPGLVKSSW